MDTSLQHKSRANLVLTDVHPPQDVIDEYALDRLPDDLREQVEHHMLVCPQCQTAVEETDLLIAMLKQAEAIERSKVIDIDALRALRTRLNLGTSGG